MSPVNEILGEILDELAHTLKDIKNEEAKTFHDTILSAGRVIVAGKGRSGFQMRGFAMRLMHLGLTASFIDDVTTPAISTHDLLVIGSGSGRTASLVHYAERAKEIGARVSLVTIDTTSPIATLADCVVQINASTPKLDEPEQTASIQPMGTLFEQSLGIFLDAIVIELMQSVDVSEAVMFEQHINLE